MWPSPHATRAKAVEMGRDLRISAPVRWASSRPSAQCRVGLLRSALSRGSAPAPERGNLVSRALSCHCGARSPRTRTWLRQSWREADPADGVRGVYRAGLVAFFGFMDTHATAWRATLMALTWSGAGTNRRHQPADTASRPRSSAARSDPAAQSLRPAPIESAMPSRMSCSEVTTGTSPARALMRSTMVCHTMAPPPMTSTRPGCMNGREARCSRVI